MPIVPAGAGRAGRALGAIALILGVASAAAAQPVIDVQIARPSLAAGAALTLGVDVQSPGGLPAADAVLVIALPDGQTVVSVGPGGPVFGQFSNLRSLVPVARGLNLAAPLTYANPAFFSYTLTGAEPAGTYTVYFALLTAGALNDGVLGGGEVLALDTTTFTVRAPIATTADLTRLATANVGPAGGTVTTAAANGTTLSVTLAPDAVAAPTAISIAPLIAAANLPPGLTFVAGVRAGPPGTVFTAPVGLGVTLPAGTPSAPKGYAGLVVNDDGSGLRIVGASRVGDVITMAVPHFSSALIVDAGDLLFFEDCADASSWSVEMVTACAQLSALYTSGAPVDDAFRAAVLDVLDTWLTTGMRPRATAAASDAPGASDGYERVLMGELPLFNLFYSAFFGNPWFGPPSRPLAAALDSFFIDMDTALLAYQDRQIDRCLADKSTLLAAGFSIDLVWQEHTALFQNTPPGRNHCVRLVIEAQTTVVPSPGTPGTVLAAVRLEFTDNMVVPNAAANIVATVTNGTVTPAGGSLIPLPVNGPLTVTLNPGATSMSLTVTAGVNVYLPPLTRTFVITAGGPPTFFNGGVIEERTAVTTSLNGMMATDGFDDVTTIPETTPIVDSFRRAQLPPGSPTNPPIYTTASSRLSLRARAWEDNSLTLNMSGGVNGTAYVLASQTSGNPSATTSGRFLHRACFTATGPSNLTYTFQAGTTLGSRRLQLLSGASVLFTHTGTDTQTGTIAVTGGTFCVEAEGASSAGVNNNAPGNRSRAHGASYTAYISVTPP